MTEENYGRIKKTVDGYDCVFERRLHHPPERVWEMITDPQRIARWYVPTVIDPRQGGRIVQHHDHADVILEGEVLALDPPRLFEHTLMLRGGEASVPDRIRWQLIPEGSGTRLILTHSFRSLKGAEDSMAGWHVLLDVLEAVLNGASPSDHMPPKGHLEGERFVETQRGVGAWEREPEIRAEYRAYLSER